TFLTRNVLSWVGASSRLSTYFLSVPSTARVSPPFLARPMTPKSCAPNWETFQAWWARPVWERRKQAIPFPTGRSVNTNRDEGDRLTCTRVLGGRGRPQGSPPYATSTPALTMITQVGNPGERISRGEDHGWSRFTGWRAG